MEGFSKPKTEKMRPMDEPERIETRTDRIEDAEKSVFSIFNQKMTEALDRIGENPYFRDLESSF